MEEREKKKIIKSFRDLVVYQLSFEKAMDIYKITKTFPKEELFSLTDQIRRSSRSVCSNLAEAWRKRRYPAVFINKLSDAAQEAAETQTWLDFALSCTYISKQDYEHLNTSYEQIFAMLWKMQNTASRFCHDRPSTL
jgi:four helix bundle protein